MSLPIASRAGACVVCGVPVPAGTPPATIPAIAGSGREPVAACLTPTCRHRLQRVPAGLRRCASCGQPLTTASGRVHGSCMTVECQQVIDARARMREHARLRAEWRERLVADAERQRAAVSADGADAPVVLVPTTDLRDFPAWVVPARPPVVRLPRRRRRAFRAHLREIVAHAVANPVADLPPVVPEPPGDEGMFFGAACGACGGRCCRLGRDRAYLTAPAIQRWLAAHPESGPADAIAAYAAHLPEATVEGSCVFHTAVGCALPRTMRSNTCNVFLCEGLTELQTTAADHAAEGRPVRRIFLAVIEEGALRAGAVVDAADVR